MKKLALYSGLVAALLVAVGTYAVAGSGSPGTKNVTADTLTGYQESPAVSSLGTGSFSATIDDDAQTISFELTYSGLSAPAAQAHIHLGNRILAGGVSAFLCGGGSKPPCPPGTADQASASGVISAADVIGPANQGIAAGEFAELVQAIRAGVTYVNVHNSNFPGGEIRAQLNDDDQREP